MNMFSKLFLVVSAGFLISSSCFAGDINQPTHLPNDARNKINKARLQGLVADDVIGDIANDAIRSSGLNAIDQYRDCSVDIGSTVADSSITSGDRDVIVTGDVINFCK